MPNVFKFNGWIKTDYSGVKQLFSFYNYCKDYANETIALDFYDCDWFDANLCALLNAIMFTLNKEQNLNFSADLVFLRSKFDVLFRNGFINDGQESEDVQKSTVPSRYFAYNDKDGFYHYISNQLMNHRGMPWHNEDMEDRIKEDLLEVFCNSNHHANTKDPIFVAGQYYPTQKVLKFTMVDVGDGFLPRIHTATNGLITTDLQAINWVMRGNSTKLYFEQTPGSLGIGSMYKYATSNNGQLDIVTGLGYWSTSFLNTLIFKDGREFELPFKGTTINLFFSRS